MISKNLSLGDRFRVGAVCRNWNLVLSQAKHDILGIPDAPWRIISENSPDLLFITQVSFESLSDEKTYRFSLPDMGGWFCGSSRGWLLMASGNRSDPNLFLWNPLNGSTRNLPPLSTHPYFAAFEVNVRNGGMCIWRLFDRVHVFSHGSADCVVAAVLSKRICPRNLMSFCTPRDDRWTTFGENEDRTTYVDVKYDVNSGSLWLLTKGGGQMQITLETLRSRGGVRLPSGCNVPISFCFLDRPFEDVDGLFDQIELPRSSLTLENSRQVYRLVEDMDGGVLIVATSVDRRFCVRDDKEVTVHDRTGQVSVIAPSDDNRSKEKRREETC